MLCTGLLLAASMVVGQAEAKMGGGVPKQVLAEMSFLVGQWKTEGVYNGEKFTGTYSAAWNPGKNCLILNTEYAGMKSTGISGWNPRTNEIVETWYRPDGLVSIQRFTAISDSKWKGTASVIEASGERKAGAIVPEKGTGTFTYEGHVGDIHLRTRFEKVKE